MYTKYLILKDEKRVIFENNKYLGQLAFYMNDCPAIQSYLKSISYNQKGMENVFNKYYDCISSEAAFQRKVEKASLEVGVIAGPTLSSLKFKSSHFEHIVDATSNYSPNVSFGLFYDIIMPRDHKKWSIYNELFFSSYKTSLDYKKYDAATSIFEYSYLKTNHFFRYKYPIRKLSVFFNAGVSVGFAIKNKNYKDYKLGFSTIHKTEMHPVLDETRKLEQSFIFGVGAKIKRFSYEIRYEQGNGMSEYSTLKSITSRYHFLCAYRL